MVGIQTVAGFQLLKDTTKYQFAATSGKSVFANLNDMKLVGLAAVSDAVDKLPRVEMAEVTSKDGLGSEAYARFRVVRNIATKVPYYFGSDEYSPVNANEALGPLLDACQEAGLHIAANVETTHDGARTKGYTIVGDADAIIEVLKDSGDNILMGFKWEFRHDGTSAVRITPFAVRVICCNDNIWGSFQEPLVMAHKGKTEEKLATASEWLHGWLEQVPTIRAKLELAARTKVPLQDIAFAALGSGLSYRTLVDWAANPSAFEPNATGEEITLWSGYNSLTGFLTHSPEAPEGDHRDHILNNLSALLADTEAMAALVAKGKEMAQEKAAKYVEQQAGTGRKTVKPLKLVGVGQ